MKNKILRFTSVVIILAVFLSYNSFSFAGTSIDESTKKAMGNESMQMHEANLQTNNIKDIPTVSVDLVEKNPTTKAIKLVGKATFTLRWIPIYNDLEGQWVIKLTNGDHIKSVYGRLIVRKDVLGPINPLLAEMEIGQVYSYGTLYNLAQGIEEVVPNGSIDGNDGYIFQWKDFFIEGIKASYYVPNSERQGKFSDII